MSGSYDRNNFLSMPLTHKIVRGCSRVNAGKEDGKNGKTIIYREHPSFPKYLGILGGHVGTQKGHKTCHHYVEEQMLKKKPSKIVDVYNLLRRQRNVPKATVKEERMRNISTPVRRRIKIFFKISPVFCYLTPLRNTPSCQTAWSSREIKPIIL